MRVNPNHAWAKDSMLHKRIEGFVVYIYCAFYALFDPIRIDCALSRALKEQFIEED